jgi:hypothetical protein
MPHIRQIILGPRILHFLSCRNEDEVDFRNLEASDFEVTRPCSSTCVSRSHDGQPDAPYCFSLAVRASPLAYRARKGAEAAAREAMRVAIALGVLGFADRLRASASEHSDTSIRGDRDVALAATLRCDDYYKAGRSSLVAPNEASAPL